MTRDSGPSTRDEVQQINVVRAPAEDAEAAKLVNIAAAPKTQEVVARIQRVQREQRLGDFSAAAAVVFAQARPEVAAPKSPDDIVAALREQEPAPEPAVEQLRTRRPDITRQA